MVGTERPVVVSAPAPRTLDLIFTPDDVAQLRTRYEVWEVEGGVVLDLPQERLAAVRYVIGQPPLDESSLATMTKLRAIFNVEGNFVDNMPYARCFERGIHILTTSAVFAQPVAELGLGLALALARDLVEADLAFRAGRERWGLESNKQAKLLAGAEIGIIGFGDLGRALHRLLVGFRAKIRAFDPWLPENVIAEYGVEPTDLYSLLRMSDVLFVTASVTDNNHRFLDADAFAAMRPGASFILLSRADVVDFPALLAAVNRGHIKAASDVFPEEPPPSDDPVRHAAHFLRSAHRAGAVDAAFKEMGRMVLDDMALLDRGLPPVCCKRAQRETVSRIRSRPVEQS